MEERRTDSGRAAKPWAPLFVNGGHMGGTDSEAQLIAALALARTGSPALEAPCTGTTEPNLQWNRGRDGRFYQAHDLGSVLLMAPAAMVGAAVSGRMPPSTPCSIPPISKAMAALTHCAAAILLAALMGALYRRFLPDTQAVGAALLCAFGTWVVLYSKLPNDVVPGGAALAGAMLCVSQLGRGDFRRDRWWALGLGLSVALIGWSRYTFLPFALLGCVLTLLHGRPRLHAGVVVTAAAVCLCALIPELLYNHVRTGNPLIPALALPQHPNQLKAPVVVGLYRLLLAPNSGLLIFSPMLAAAALGPCLVRSGFDRLRSVGVGFGLACLPYAFVVARLEGAGRGPFGPRLLFITTPVLCAWVALLIARYRPARHRAMRVLVGLLLIWSLLPTLPHLELARSSLVPASMDIRTPWPATHAAVFRAIGMGLAGRELPAPPDVANDPVRSLGRRFPDFWWAHLIRLGGAARVVGWSVGALLTLALAWSASRLRQWWRGAASPTGPSDQS